MNNNHEIQSTSWNRGRIAALLLAFLLTWSGLGAAQERPHQSNTYLGVWADGARGDVTTVREATWTALNQRWEDLRRQGFGLVELESFIEEGERVFFALFAPRTEEQRLTRSVDVAQWTSDYERLTSIGLRLQDFEVLEEEGRPVFLGAWGPGTGEHKLFMASSWAEFVHLLKKTRDFHLEDFEVFSNAGKLEVAGMWSGGFARQELLEGASWQQLVENWHFQQEKGRGLRRAADIEAYEIGGARRFAALWTESPKRGALRQVLGASLFEQQRRDMAVEGFVLVELAVFDGPVFRDVLAHGNLLPPARAWLGDPGDTVRGKPNEVEPISDPGSVGPDEPDDP